MQLRRGLRIGIVVGAAFSSASFALLRPAHAQSSTEGATLSQGLDAIAQKHNLERVWLYVQRGNADAVNIGIRGADANAPEPIGSLSKSITGIAIALLVQQGKLSLNSTMADVLGKLYARHNRPMDANLKAVTVERLLTHTAGLRPNKLTDPVNGFVTDGITAQLNPDSDTFDFLKISDGDHSNGRAKMVYSNMSYLMLGLVVEAVSGEDYESFCRSHIFGPLQISDVQVLGGRYRSITAFSGWILSRHDIAKVWLKVFNPANPSILTKATLSKTLYAPLGQPLGSNHDVRYVMGTNVKPSSNNSTYRLSHNGVQSTYQTNSWDGNNYYSYMEDTIPGYIWVYAVSRLPPQTAWRSINDDIRKLVESTVGH